LSDIPQILQLQQEAVARVFVPDELLDKIAGIRSALAQLGISVSDRRFIIRAAAFLAGRSVAEEDDLLVLRHVLEAITQAKAATDAREKAEALLRGIGILREHALRVDF